MSGKLRWHYYLEKISKRLDEGLSPKELDDRYGGSIPHDTLYKILNALEKCKFIYKDETTGKYYHYWKKIIQEFHSSEEYKAKLEHSKRLLFPKDFLGREVGVYSIVDSILEDKENILGSCLKEHLRHYPTIYSKYQELKKIKKEKEDVEKKFEKKIGEFLRIKGFKVVPSDANITKMEAKDIFDFIFEVAKNLFREKSHVENYLAPEVKFEDGYVIVGRYKRMPLSENKNSIDKIRELIDELLKNSEIFKEFERLEKISKRYHETYCEFASKIEFLRQEVLNGTPLRGVCKHCPKIKIGEK